MHASERKTILRQEVNKRLAEMTDDQRHAEGRTLSRVLLKKIPRGSTVCAYFPLKTEADIRLLLKELIERGDAVFLPVYVGKDKLMVYRKAESLHYLPPGEFTIPEPPDGAEELGDRKADVILVPGRAFDKKGNRLGRGSGGYDKWLERYQGKHPDTPLWGVCLTCQLVQEVPVELHDINMDAVITAQEWIELR